MISGSSSFLFSSFLSRIRFAEQEGKRERNKNWLAFTMTLHTFRALQAIKKRWKDET